jgi:hypothetical protein
MTLLKIGSSRDPSPVFPRGNLNTASCRLFLEQGASKVALLGHRSNPPLPLGYKLNLFSNVTEYQPYQGKIDRQTGYRGARTPGACRSSARFLGLALSTLGERTHDRAKLEEARNAVNAAFDVFMQAGQEHYRPYFEDRLQAIDRQLAVQ